MVQKVCFSLIVLLLLNACAGRSTEETAPPAGHANEEPLNPYAPVNGDEGLQRGEVDIDSQEILILESFPPQFRLHVTGALPTPCHQLRAVVHEPNDQNQIHVEIYSVVNPNTVCIQVLEPFEASIPLGSNLEGGSYTVFVNGELVGEINPVPSEVPVTPAS
jgi:hypothetical protein